VLDLVLPVPTRQDEASEVDYVANLGEMMEKLQDHVGLKAFHSMLQEASHQVANQPHYFPHQSKPQGLHQY
jgi:hypothetical protein